jgi:hypothetical protein
LQITVLRAVDLDLKTIREEPGVHDLPITPLFASFCAPCIAEAVVTDDDSNFFVLGRKVYSSFTSSNEDLEIPCIYNSSNPRFSAIAETSKKSSPIFTAMGELFIGENLTQIVCTEVEWTFPKLKLEQNLPVRDVRRQKLLDIEERYVGKKSNNRHKSNNSSSLSFASSSTSTSTSPSTSTAATITAESRSSKRQVVVVEDDEPCKKVCSELSPSNRPVTRAKALQAAKDQVDRKGKGPELPCSNDEEGEDLDHRSNGGANDEAYGDEEDL